MRGSALSFPLNRHTRRQPSRWSPCATLRTDDPPFRPVFVCVVEACIHTVNLCVVLAKLAPPSPLAFAVRNRPQRLGPVACSTTSVPVLVRCGRSLGSRWRVLRGAARAKSSSSRRYAPEPWATPVATVFSFNCLAGNLTYDRNKLQGDLLHVTYFLLAVGENCVGIEADALHLTKKTCHFAVPTRGVSTI